MERKGFLEKRRANSGITLIALVITIIVFLILAGISIATLTGKNGVLNKASTAKEQSIIAEESEIIKIAYTDSLADNIIEEKEITSTILQEEINKTKTATVEEVNEIPEGAIVIDNGATKGTICKITMEYVYYMYLNDNLMKKFYIELYDASEELLETLTFNFEDGMDIDVWKQSKYCIGLEDFNGNETYPGGWVVRFYDFFYNGDVYYMDITVEDDNGYTGEDEITEGKIFKAIKK